MAAPGREQLARVEQIEATCSAFAAILQNGSVVTWGNAQDGAAAGCDSR